MKIGHNIDPELVSSLFIQLYGSFHFWNMDSEDIVDINKLVKELVQYLMLQNTNGQTFLSRIYIDRKKEPIDKLINEKNLQNKKRIEMLLLTMTIVNLGLFIIKIKIITYTGIFVKLYNQRKPKEIH